MRDALKYLFIILLLACCCSLAAIGPNFLEFIQEDLVFRLDGKTLELDGDYWFCNNTQEDITQQLYFPIPSDSMNAPAEKIRLVMTDPMPGQTAKIISVNKHGFWFEVSLPTQTIAVCQISYQQKLQGNSARYVLMSTHSWGKPLEWVKYTLITTKKLQIDKLPLPDPLIKVKGRKRIYQWELTNFMPEDDFIVEFHR